jgi:MscS family membrane protein
MNLWTKSKLRMWPRAFAWAFLTWGLFAGLNAWSQPKTKSAPPKETPTVESPQDTLGRISPRGAVLGFLNAARKGNAEVAVLYLNTPLRGEPAQHLAQQLAVVLDRRLPARLNQLSDSPEGSLPDPLRPDEDIVGTITTKNGNLDITLERVDRGKSGLVWLFSKKTLSLIPDVFEEVTTPPVERFLPAFMVKTRVAGVPLFEYAAFVLGLPLLYLLTGLLNRVLGFGFGIVWRTVMRKPNAKNPTVMVQPVRLFLIALTIQSTLSVVGLPLLARQFWSTVALVISIVSTVWLLLLLNGWGEKALLRRLHRDNRSGATSVLRLTRRVIDVAILFAGFLFTLRRFGVDPTAALAGLGVGGIAVALAAQKTLENVIGGISLIADKALRVGDVLRLGDVLGAVEAVGLRSTRIRTMDRTIVIVPNSQIANASLETLSARDKFWFHHVAGLRYETTVEQMRAVIEGVLDLLASNANVNPGSMRVRFIHVGPFSLDVDIFAYITASDWDDFLKIQEGLLFSVMDIVSAAGAAIAFPSHTLYFSGDPTTLRNKSSPTSSVAEDNSAAVAHAKSA